MTMGREFLSKLKESCVSILPIILLIIILNFASASFRLDEGTMAGPTFVSFVVSAIPLLLGMTLFNMGAEKAMGKIGEVVGTTLTKRKSLALLVVIAILLGTLMTVAEPDLTVLSQRLLPSGPNWLLVAVAALGVGIMLAVAVIRVILQKSLKIWVVIAYGLVFALGCMADPDFFPIVFDSGGATTSAISSPFIIAFGVGIASVRGGRNSEDDSFGYAGICSLGPLITVMLLGIFLDKGFILGNLTTEIDAMTSDSLTVFADIGPFYANQIVSAITDVSISISPIVVFFFIYNIFLKLRSKELLSIIVGLVYTYVGLVIFLFGANAGFIPVATALGSNFVHVDEWIFLVFGAVIGCLIVIAEPAVHVLADQVAEVTRGTIRKGQVFVSLAIGTGLAVLFNVIRVVYNINMIYFVIPIYICGFVLAFLVPEIYVAIAFDSTGVATGTLSSCFLLPLFIGYVNLSSNGDADTVLKEGFGIIGMISTMPIIAIEALGLYGVIKNKVEYRRALKRVMEVDDDQVIHLPLGEGEVKEKEYGMAQ